MAPHSGALAWRVPEIEEPGTLYSMGSLRVGQYSCLEIPMDRGAWSATVQEGLKESRSLHKLMPIESVMPVIVYYLCKS